MRDITIISNENKLLIAAAAENLKAAISEAAKQHGPDSVYEEYGDIVDLFWPANDDESSWMLFANEIGYEG